VLPDTFKEKRTSVSIKCVFLAWCFIEAGYLSPLQSPHSLWSSSRLIINAAGGCSPGSYTGLNVKLITLSI